MDYRDILNVRSKVLEELRATGNPAHPRLFKLLEHKYFGGYSKVWEAVSNNRVKKYTFDPSGRTLWIVVGKETEYIVHPEVSFCSCDAFYFFVLGEKTKFCYHIIAQAVAEALGWYDVVKENDCMFDVLISEWRGDVFSKTERPPEGNHSDGFEVTWIE